MVHGGGHHGGGGGGGGGGWVSSGGGNWGGGHHGGGHHHGWGRHNRHHGGGWFGNARGHNRTNVVVVNSAPPIGYPGGFRSNGYSYQRLDRGGRNHGSDAEFEECCNACCCGIFGVLCCCCVPRKGLCKWIVLSIVIFVVLMVVSHVEEEWTLNAGESRRVNVPWLTRSLKVSSTQQNGVQVYAFKKCPSLDGTPVTLQNRHEVHLARNDYQYDYFYLNAGSTISADVYQETGMSKLMLLRGQNNFENFENDDHYQTLQQDYATAGQSVTLQYTVSKSDMYAAIYDNVSSGSSRATVTYRVDLTTFNLKGHNPMSPQYCDSEFCAFEVKKECMLVQATPGGSSGNTVKVNISSDRQWWLLISLSCIPLLIGFKKTRSSRVPTPTNVAQQEPADPERPPAFSPDAAMPPPATAPPAVAIPEPVTYPVASAPVEEEPPMAHAVAAADYDSIAIPAENVIPVSAPTAPVGKP